MLCSRGIGIRRCPLAVCAAVATPVKRGSGIRSAAFAPPWAVKRGAGIRSAAEAEMPVVAVAVSRGAGIRNAVIHAIGFLAGLQHILVAQYRQMLGNIALGSTNRLDDILDTHLLITDDAKNLEAQGMRNGLQRPRRSLDMFLLVQ